jgi:hypothetical protein
MTHDEYMTGIQSLREWSVQPQQARQYSSFNRMAADKKQHRRVEYNAQQALQEPITAAQIVSDIPWGTRQDPRHLQNSVACVITW